MLPQLQAPELPELTGSGWLAAAGAELLLLAGAVSVAKLLATCAALDSQ